MADKKMVFSQEEIASRVAELGLVLTKRYSGRQLLVIGILNGAFVFMADLVRAIDLPLEIDFVRVASYGSGTVSSGEIKFTKNVEIPLAGKDVLLVEDIVDTGRTLAYLKQILRGHNPSSLKVCALIDKKERRTVDVEVDYPGFELSEGFLVGYGLDCAEQYRNLASIYHLQG